MKELNTILSAIFLLPFATYASSDVHKSEVTVGIGAQYAPQYMGADKFDSTVAPYFEWTDGTLFLNSEKGAGLTYSFDNGFTWDRLWDIHGGEGMMTVPGYRMVPDISKEWVK
jgi:outer membrane scaffolding protein for murein synthesis (MipA/OmpV family)